MHSKKELGVRTRFVTLFPAATDIHLVKDVGQIPYILARDFGYDSTLVTQSAAPFSSLQNDTPGLKIHALHGLPGSIAPFVYLLRHARRIDVLNVYHMRLQSKLFALLYKALNRRGFVYVKLDLNIHQERAALQNQGSAKGLSGALRRFLNGRFFAAADLFSVESQEALALAGMRYPGMRGKMIEVTNGLDLTSLYRQCPPLAHAEKQDLIISIGRPGDPNKNHELLLDALTHVQLGKWKVAFIGPTTPAFEQKFKVLLAQRPQLAGVVELIGTVRDRVKLMGWYSRAKAFILTSHSEGFPLVFGEAQSYSNYILSTDVSCIREVLLGERFGKVIDADAGDGLVPLLQEFIDGAVYTKQLSEELAGHAGKKYEWRFILQAVDLKIKARQHA